MVPILALLPAQPTMITAGRMESRPRHQKRTVCFHECHWPKRTLTAGGGSGSPDRKATIVRGTQLIRSPRRRERRGWSVLYPLVFRALLSDGRGDVVPDRRASLE